MPAVYVVHPVLPTAREFAVLPSGLQVRREALGAVRRPAGNGRGGAAAVRPSLTEAPGLPIIPSLYNRHRLVLVIVELLLY